MFPLLSSNNFQLAAYFFLSIHPHPLTMTPAPTSCHSIWNYLFVFLQKRDYFQSPFYISKNSEPVLATSSEYLGGVWEECRTAHTLIKEKRFTGQDIFLKKRKKACLPFSVKKKKKLIFL